MGIRRIMAMGRRIPTKAIMGMGAKRKGKRRAMGMRKGIPMQAIRIPIMNTGDCRKL